jgi:hypothetical protein
MFGSVEGSGSILLRTGGKSLEMRKGEVFWVLQIEMFLLKAGRNGVRDVGGRGLHRERRDPNPSHRCSDAPRC